MEKRVIPVWLSIVGAILVIGSMVWTVANLVTYLTVGGLPPVAIVCWILTVLAQIAALLYGFTGYKKDSAVFFLIFIILYTLMVFIAGLSVKQSATVFSALDMLQFGALCILAVSKDLGKKKSYVICGIIVIIGILRIIIKGITVNGISGMVSNLVLAIILGIMVYAKYCDKAVRGTD